MKLWQYNVLSFVLGSAVMYITNLILPIFIFFVLYGQHIAWFAAIYILGRCVLSLALPGTYAKIRESRCQDTKRVA